MASTTTPTVPPASRIPEAGPPYAVVQTGATLEEERREVLAGVLEWLAAPSQDVEQVEACSALLRHLSHFRAFDRRVPLP